MSLLSVGGQIPVRVRVKGEGEVPVLEHRVRRVGIEARFSPS